jgi:hypothetical protein
MNDPDHHVRRSLRLKGYDYSQAGAYFVTVCAHDRMCIFCARTARSADPSARGPGMTGAGQFVTPYRYKHFAITVVARRENATCDFCNLRLLDV